jgi:hypothetical protein
MDETTGDLRFRFENDLLLEVFNFTRFEIWAITFSDGSLACPITRSIRQSIMISRDVSAGVLRLLSFDARRVR